MIARSLVPTTVARYGESPLRVLATGAGTILSCGVLYYAFDLIQRSGDSGTVTLFDAMYFSALTFTTLGYGDFNPTDSAGQVLAVAETSMGVILLAILVFVFGRRATR
jgi:voltage-gated potassium channel Kch